MDDHKSDPNSGRNYPSRQDADFPERYTADDEISLYDLWNVLERRWYVIVGVFVAVVGLAFIYTLNQEATYQFRTGLEIGTLGSGDSLVESSDQTRNRLREAIIPSVRAELSGEMENVPSIDIGGGEESSLIVLTTTGTVDRREDIQTLHQDIAARLGEAHRRVIDSRINRVELREESLEDELEYITDDRVLTSRRESREQRIESGREQIGSLEEQREEEATDLELDVHERQRRLDALEEGRVITEAELERVDEREETEVRERQRRLESLDEEREIITAELERLDDRAELLEARIESTKELLADLRSSRMRLLNATGDDSSLALFLGTTELESVQTRLNSLEDQLNFGLAQQREDLRKSIQDNSRSRQRVNDELTELRLDFTRERERLRADLEDNRRSEERVREQIATIEAEREKLDDRFDRKIAAERRTIDEQETALALLEADVRQERREKERAIREIEAEMNDITPTTAGFVSVRSVEQAGTGTTLIMALAIVLGGLLGMFSAFFWEFVSNARRYRRQP